MIAVVVIFVVHYIAYLLLQNVRERNGRMATLTRACKPPEVEQTDIVYHGKENAITSKDMHDILSRRLGYYRHLHPQLQDLFLRRLKNFMNKKIYIIKDDEIFREMPVLVSASAIQLTLGLPDYQLHFYKYIRIHPQEYLADHSFSVLAGNVANNTITVAWNHFLQGYEHHNDGANLGLHEMSHALYFQKLVIDGSMARDFCEQYELLISHCHPASVEESTGVRNLYSEYADTDLQEFWAETVELFFEKPRELQEHYPGVYDCVRNLLNQDPVNPSFPLLLTRSSLATRLRRFFLES